MLKMSIKCLCAAVMFPLMYSSSCLDLEPEMLAILHSGMGGGSTGEQTLAGTASDCPKYNAIIAMLKS